MLNTSLKFKFMIHNFESWRKATEERYKSFALAHYHKVDDELAFSVLNLLRQIVIRRVDKGANVSIHISEEQAQCIVDFLDQMNLAYIHPRSSSARYEMMRSLSMQKGGSL